MAIFPVNKDSDVEFLLTHLTGIPEDPRKTIIQLQEYKDGVGKNLHFINLRTNLLGNLTSKQVLCHFLSKLFFHHLISFSNKKKKNRRKCANGGGNNFFKGIYQHFGATIKCW